MTGSYDAVVKGVFIFTAVQGKEIERQDNQQ
jgi:hypothetical protein